MSLTVINKDTTLQELRALKPLFEKQYGVTRIGIFGSMVRNEADDHSDLDIVVEMQPNLFNRAKLKSDLELFFGKKVDVVRYWHGMNGFLKKRIDAEALYV